MIVIGSISGTSLDGIDVAAARLTGAGTDRLHMQLLAHRTIDWSDELRRRLLAVLPPASCEVAEVCRLDILAGREIAAAIASMQASLPGGHADLAVSHGQTVYHWVQAGTAHGGLQLGQPAATVEMTGLPVISDVRSQDIAAGGQGAPLAGMLDTLVLRGIASEATSCALNLGGIANVTVAGPTTNLAFDTGPANTLIDTTVSRLTGGTESCDTGGRRATRGSVDQGLLAMLLADPYYAWPAPKSTGRERFHATYVTQALARYGHVADDDLVATLTELTAATVADALAPHHVTQVYGSGGGMHNPALVARLRERLQPATLARSDELGLPVDAKEAYLMALLGYLTWHGIPAVPIGSDGRTLTGAADARVLGRISPGRHPLRLPAPCPPPRSMTIDEPNSI